MEDSSRGTLQTIRAMHPDDLAELARQVLLVSRRRGRRVLLSILRNLVILGFRMRHLPFAVDSSARDAWMLCMKVALEKVVVEEDVRTTLFQTLPPNRRPYEKHRVTRATTLHCVDNDS